MHFSAEIEADLQQVYGVNLRKMFRERQWRRLLNLIDQLPTTSRLSEAMLQDKEIVTEIYRKTPKGEKPKEWAPRVSEMDANLRALGMIYNRLGDVAQAVMSTIQVPEGKSRPKYQGGPFPQPDTLFEEIARRESRETGLWLMEQFMPHAGGWD